MLDHDGIDHRADKLQTDLNAVLLDQEALNLAL
ncbi:hypothetical protein JOD69_003091 [Methylocaldum sp. RMAD-M]|nr:hypothetical protein [Methylocaldum sp. RMAD-M]